MGNLLKDLAVLMFAASQEIDRKTAEFRGKREERFKKFVRGMEESKDEFMKKHEKEVKKAREKVSEVAGKIGIATVTEIDELKKMVAELGDKIDKVLKGQ